METSNIAALGAGRDKMNFWRRARQLPRKGLLSLSSVPRCCRGDGNASVLPRVICHMEHARAGQPVACPSHSRLYPPHLRPLLILALAAWGCIPNTVVVSALEITRATSQQNRRVRVAAHHHETTGLPGEARQPATGMVVGDGAGHLIAAAGTHRICERCDTTISV